MIDDTVTVGHFFNALGTSISKMAPDRGSVGNLRGCRKSNNFLKSNHKSDQKFNFSNVINANGPVSLRLNALHTKRCYICCLRNGLLTFCRQTLTDWVDSSRRDVWIKIAGSTDCCCCCFRSLSGPKMINDSPSTLITNDSWRELINIWANKY